MRSAAPRALALIAAGALLFGAATGRAADDTRTIPTRPGVTQAFLLVKPSGPPVASVILFAGGNGLLALGSGRLGLAGNFLVRNRARFAGLGLLVAVVDAPSDHPTGLDGFRTSAAHAEDIRAVIAALKQEAPVPVWLVGTSMGTVSAANGAARLTTGAPDGLVLTSTVTRVGRQRIETVGDVRLDAVRVPTLIVHHKNDACRPHPTLTRRLCSVTSSRCPGASCWRSTVGIRPSRPRARRARRTAFSAWTPRSSPPSPPGSRPRPARNRNVVGPVL